MPSPATRWTTPWVLLLLTLLVLAGAGSAQTGATDLDRGTVNVFLPVDSIRIEVGEKTFSPGVVVDSAAGNTTTISFEVGLSQNNLKGPTNVTIALQLDPVADLAPEDLNLTANTTRLVVDQDSPRRVPGNLTWTIPRVLEERQVRATLVVTIDAEDTTPGNNEVDLRFQFGEYVFPNRGFGFRPAMLIAPLAALALLGGAYAYARRDARTSGGLTKRITGAQDALRDRLRDVGTARLRRALAGAVILLVIVTYLLVSGFFRVPSYETLRSLFVLGIMVGAIYALIAVGYTLVYGTLKFINFAHGEIFAWGGYFAFFFAVWIPRKGWDASLGPLGPVITNFFVACILAILATALLGYLVERVAYRPLRSSPRLNVLITAIGVSLFLEALAQFFFSANQQSMSEATSQVPMGDTTLERTLGTTVDIAGAPVSILGLVILAAGVLAMLGLHLFVQRTRTGKALRAVSDNMDNARILGIHVDRIVSVTFMVGSAVAAVGGILYGLLFTLRPTVGLLPGIKAFTAAVVGGIGNVYGAFLGGLLIGIAENVGGGFIDSRFQEAIAFVILILFLIIRPSGIFGTEHKTETRRK